MTRALTILLLLALGTSQAACPPIHHDLESTVQKVNDGDTLVLTNGTRVRFIGINTPELGRNGKPEQAYARQATRALKQLLESASNKVILQYGKQHKDRYRRRLAHVFLADGTNISEVLLQQGLAYRVAVPPNLNFQECYQQAEQVARQKQRGLWSTNRLSIKHLPQLTRGFHLVRGKILRLGHSKKSVWLNLDGPLSVRIARKDLSHFSHLDFEQLANSTVVVRGWIHNYKNSNIMRLRHSSMIEIMK